ncbi:hypothetical protein B6V76_11300 [Thioclava sp. IC9]|nr:hypothetical protein B6V76_11300 [Thioclava sp. IC9]PWE48636.1 hypothetical protein DEM26_17780 [Thioclava sp. NG1]
MSEPLFWSVATVVDPWTAALILSKPTLLYNHFRGGPFFGHVVSLPITIEIARVCGFRGYQLTNLRADIGLEM